MIDSSADRNKKLQKIFLNCAHLYSSNYAWVPEKQEATSKSNWHRKTHVCVPSHSNNTVPLTMEAATPTPYKPPAQENLKLSLDEQSHSVIFGPQNRRKKRKNKTKHSDRLAVSMLFCLQRQDLLFWSLSQGDHITAPHKHCRQVSSRLWGSSPALFFFGFPRE